MADGAPVRIFAPAKLNLYLHVTGKRDDGRHTLDSLVAFADIGDVVVAEPAGSLSLGVDGPFGADLADEPDNLVLQAARALRKAAGAPSGARLTLTKNLPIASGVGGGSADAAAALHALAALWNVSLSKDDVKALCSPLGADVPVCFHGRSAYMGGVGEKIADAPPLPSAAIVLVNPGVYVPTPPVFRARTGPFQVSDRFGGPIQDAAHLARLLKSRRNGLTEAAVSLAPVIGEALRALEQTDGLLLARMMGSGATCLGLFGSAAAAKDAAAVLAAARPGWWVRAGNLLA